MWNWNHSLLSHFFSCCCCCRHIFPRLSARPPAGSSADSAARPHAVRSGQAPRGMTSSLQIKLKALEMRKGLNVLALKPCQLESEHWKLCPFSCRKAWMVELPVELLNIEKSWRFIALLDLFSACVISLSLLSSCTAGCGDWRSRRSGCQSHAHKRRRVSKERCKRQKLNRVSFVFCLTLVLSLSHSGCLTQEKIVAGCAKHFIVIADYRFVFAGSPWKKKHEKVSWRVLKPERKNASSFTLKICLYVFASWSCCFLPRKWFRKLEFLSCISVN